MNSKRISTLSWQAFLLVFLGMTMKIFCCQLPDESLSGPLSQFLLMMPVTEAGRSMHSFYGAHVQGLFMTIVLQNDIGLSHVTQMSLSPTLAEV